MSASERARQLATVAWAAAADKQADDLIAIDVSDRLALTDVFLIGSARNEPQLGAIAKNIETKLVAAGFKPTRVEGHRGGEWFLLDYNDVIVHLFREDARDHYSLERLWRDCPTLGLDMGTVEENGPDTRTAGSAG